jgi:hypothetical protein
MSITCGSLANAMDKEWSSYLHVQYIFLCRPRLDFILYTLGQYITLHDLPVHITLCQVLTPRLYGTVVSLRRQIVNNHWRLTFYFLFRHFYGLEAASMQLSVELVWSLKSAKTKLYYNGAALMRSPRAAGDMVYFSWQTQTGEGSYGA